MSLDGAEARGVRQPPGADVAQPLDLHYRRLRVREPLPVAEFRLPVPAKDLQDLLPHLGMVLQIYEIRLIRPDNFGHIIRVIGPHPLLDLGFPDHEEDGEGQRGARRLRAGKEQVGRRVDDLLVPLGLVKTGLLVLGNLPDMEPISCCSQFQDVALLSLPVFLPGMRR